MLKKILFLVLLPALINAKTVNTNELLVMNLDELKSVISKYIDSSQNMAIKSQKEGNEEEKQGDVVYELKKALLIVMARPNRDFMSVKLLPDIERNLRRYEAYHSTLSSLCSEAIRTINDKDIDVKIQSSYLYVIENTLAELKPELKNNEEARTIYKKIASEKIKVSKKLANFRRLEKMESNDFSPNKYAQKQLDLLNGVKKPWWKFW